MPQAEGSLFALFHRMNDSDAVELSADCTFVSGDLSAELQHAFLIPHPSNGTQLWRSSAAAKHAAEQAFVELQENPYEFAITSNVTSSVSLQPRDMVYVPSLCAIAEVKSIGHRSMLSITIANELHHEPRRNSTRAFYQFSYTSKTIDVKENDVQFPIDLSFDPTTGIFELKKSENMTTV